MVERIKLLIFIFLLLGASEPSFGMSRERVQEIRVHGNYRTSDAEILKLAGLEPGSEVSDSELAIARGNLLKSGKFESASILKRYRSLQARGDLVLVISVEEKIPASNKFMFFPILEYTDEYGFTYGGRFTTRDLLGAGERLSFPLTWGGTRQAAAELRLPVRLGVSDYLLGETAIRQQTNPAFDTTDRRTKGAALLEKRFSRVRVHYGGQWENVLFSQASEKFPTALAEAVVDTRSNPILPRNSFYAGIGWSRHFFAERAAANRLRIDVRGYRGFFGRSVLASQLLFHLSDRALPDFQKPLLGGASTLRGYAAGKFAGDNAASASVELRIPLHTPGRRYRTGMNLFYDVGSVYDHGVSIRSSRFHSGAGAGIWVFAFGLGVKVEAGYDFDGNVRVHFSTGFRF